MLLLYERKTFYIKWKKDYKCIGSAFLYGQPKWKRSCLHEFSLFLLFFFLHSLLQIHTFFPLNVWKCSNDVSAGWQSGKCQRRHFKGMVDFWRLWPQYCDVKRLQNRKKKMRRKSNDKLQIETKFYEIPRHSHQFHTISAVKHFRIQTKIRFERRNISGQVFNDGFAIHHGLKVSKSNALKRWK